MQREAELYKKIGEVVECTACARRCRLKPGQTGFCGVRKNIDGKLVLLNYGKAAVVHVDPIEKKPLSHFYPGSRVLSIGTTGCNWACKYCQNYDISQRRVVEGEELPPEEAVRLAVENKCDGIAYTYNEPTIFMEYAHDTALLARKKGLFNVFVSNGFMTPESARYASTFLDAITVDFKGNADKEFLGRFALVHKVKPIFDSLLILKKQGVHIEITDLVIPKVGDNLEKARELVKWIINNLGDEVPLHFLRFHPEYKMADYPSTPVETLEKHWKIAKEEGLKYAYIGNVPGHELENTHCPKCGRVVVERLGFNIIQWNLTPDNRCVFCNEKIAIKGGLKEGYEENRFYQPR